MGVARARRERLRRRPIDEPRQRRALLILVPPPPLCSGKHRSLKGSDRRDSCPQRRHRVRVSRDPPKTSCTPHRTAALAPAGASLRLLPRPSFLFLFFVVIVESVVVAVVDDCFFFFLSSSSSSS